jgi:hypothetical protein
MQASSTALVPVEARAIAAQGARKVTLAELQQLPSPSGTDTHQVIPHQQVYEEIRDGLALRGLQVVATEFVVTNDEFNGKLFGVLEVNHDFLGTRFAIGLRNSHDKSLRLSLVVGYRVVVCSNLMFKGDFYPLAAKHTRNFALQDALSVGLDRMCRQFKPLEESITAWRSRPISDNEARLLLYQGFVEGRLKIPTRLVKEAHNTYFQPSEHFGERTFWSLSNACTQAMKQLKPAQFYAATARLGTFLEACFGQ